MNGTERKKAQRIKLRKAGFIPVEIWTFDHLKDRIRAYVAKLNKGEK